MISASSRQIRLCDEKDIPTLLDLATTTFVEAFWDTNDPKSMTAYMETAFREEVFLKEMQHPDAQFFLVLEDEVPAGYLKINRVGAQSDVHDPKSLEVERIYVLADFQGVGIGKYLLDYAIQVATAENLTYVWLGVWEYNDKAIAFYQKQGFRVFSDHPFVMGEEVQTDLLMRKYLS